MRKLIGITGFARSGKDTFFERADLALKKESLRCERVAFADALKNEVDDLLKTHTGISAFTENDEEKSLVRPLLVTYGTDIRRKLNQNCWIEKVQPIVIEHLENNKFVFVTDVRFKNEAEWIKMNGGFMVKVERDGVGPANHEEHKQSVLMKQHIDYKIAWPTFGDDEISNCDEFILPTLSAIVQQAKTYENAYQEIM